MKKLIFLIFVVGLTSCTLKEEHKVETKTYFDLEGYFERETVRLSKMDATIVKTVSINGKAEQKKIIIKNWEQELGSFKAADINKASWKGEFKKTTADLNYTITTETYSTNNPKIAVKNLKITTRDKKVIAVKIIIENENDLYTSIDSLSYYPDSLYLIKKTQKIKLMAAKTYQVSGKFK